MGLPSAKVLSVGSRGYMGYIGFYRGYVVFRVLGLNSVALCYVNLLPYVGDRETTSFLVIQASTSDFFSM